MRKKREKFAFERVIALALNRFFFREKARSHNTQQEQKEEEGGRAK
jgi:hypothetical protein